MLYPSLWGKIWRRLRDWRETAIARPFWTFFCEHQTFGFLSTKSYLKQGSFVTRFGSTSRRYCLPHIVGWIHGQPGVSIILLWRPEIANSQPFQIDSPARRRIHNSPPQNHAMKRSFCSWIARFAPFSGEWIHGGEMSVFLIVPLDPEKNSATKRAIFFPLVEKIANCQP